MQFLPRLISLSLMTGILLNSPLFALFAIAQESDGITPVDLIQQTVIPEDSELIIPQIKEQETKPANIVTEKLLLPDLIKIVELYHPKILSADIERRIAKAKLLEKQGAFDPNLAGESQFLRYNDFSQRGKESETFDNDIALNLLTRSGLKLSTGASYNNGDVKPPLYPTGDTGEYFMGLKMPLLRGFIINEKSIAERQAKIGIPEADAEFFRVRLEQLNLTAQSYWDWVASYKKRIAVEDALKLAKDRHLMIKNRVIVGDLPAIDEAEALQEIFKREALYSKAIREIEKSTFKLSSFIWKEDGTPDQLPTEAQSPESIEDPVLLEESIWLEDRANAIETRPEVRGIALQKEITTLDVKLAKNNLLPQVDIFATPGMDTGGFSIGPTVKAGVQFSVPLRRRTARGQVQIANYKLDKLNIQERQLLQKIILEVDDAYSQVKTSYEQYQAAKNEWTLAQAIENGERTKFNLGDSSLFLLNQRERATLDALFKMIELKAQYHQSVATYKVATNTL